MIYVKAGKGMFFVTIGSSVTFNRDKELIKSLPPDKRAWSSQYRRWEVSYDQFWRVCDMFSDIHFITPKENIEEMLGRVYIHLHRQFKNQLAVTSIKNPIPKSIVSDELQIIQPGDISRIEEYCQKTGLELVIAEGVEEFVKEFKEEEKIDFDYTGFKLDLYPFQEKGALFLAKQGRAILADMTGLGKCPQSLGAATLLYERGDINKILVFCPNSIKGQWRDECVKFTNLRPLLIGGSKGERSRLYDLGRTSQYQVIIVNYDLLIYDLERIMSVRPDLIICDEASYIKNMKAKRSKAIKNIPATHKFALSATPLENSPIELFSICNWMDPEILGPWFQFEHQHVVRDYWGGIKRFNNLEVLKRKLAGVMLRRRKDEVADQLPDVVTQVRQIELDRTARWVYETISSDTINLIDKVGASLMKLDEDDVDFDTLGDTSPLAMFSLLRQVCDDARMLATSESQYAQRLAARVDLNKTKSRKLDEIEAIVRDIVDSGDKVVIFTEWTRMLDLVRDRLRSLSTIVEISGRVNSDQ